MKIDKFTRLITALDYGTQSQQAGSEAQPKTDPVQNSPAAQPNTEAVRASANLDLDRAERVARIKEQVGQGAYKIESSAVAKSFIEEFFS